MEYDYDELKDLYLDKHRRLVACLSDNLALNETIQSQRAELVVLERYVKDLECYIEGLESVCPVQHGQTKPRRY